MESQTIAKLSIQPSRIYRAQEDCWYRVDSGWFGKIYRRLTGKVRLIKEAKNG